MTFCLRRREFIAGLGGAAAWPLTTRAQRRGRLRHVGIHLSSMADDPVFQTWVGAFQQGLAQSGWIIGRNVHIDPRWAEPEPMTFVGTRRNWSRSRLTSSSRMAA